MMRLGIQACGGVENLLLYWREAIVTAITNQTASPRVLGFYEALFTLLTRGSAQSEAKRSSDTAL